jgi:hypothetical protein
VGFVAVIVVAACSGADMATVNTVMHDARHE